jgi:hypothetical protein
MKKRPFLLVFGIIVLLLSASHKAPEDTRLGIYYFYESLCETCTGPDEFNSIWPSVLTIEDREKYPCFISTINVFDRYGGQLYEEITDKIKLDRNTITLPVLVVGSYAIQGNDTIKNRLKEVFYSAAREHYKQ